ncbi:hypothetical protein UCREL1_1070 [Eutypa lata UCREL1]|uniref:DUF3074 domain-containing protein n=1 Tax=Eutypa lata (strain UCR-EL1) TaxID=1287681 RepID=M7T4R0_EUTLA|nr:hypothetical protein UCREL1_1070 [Eutypa lata UCREL1]
MTPAPHEPLKALGPINWDFGHGDSVEEETKIRRFLSRTFAEAECIIDSIPTDSTSAPQVGRPRSSTDPNRPNLPNKTRQLSDCARELRKEWKEAKVNAKENPLCLSVYKLAAKDGRGSWFARRSVHEGQSFEKWKLAMEKEFAESMKVKGKPGSGSIRGIGADKRVEHMVLDGCGKLEGFIRGAYESVEMIREIRTETKVDPLRKVQSSIDLPIDEANAIARNTMNQLAHEAPIRAARQPRLNGVPETDVLGHQSSESVSTMGAESSEQQQQRSPIEMEYEYETKIEWLMVTRSDPGGSVPRFMVEKGTPGAIAGDADKFLKWTESKTLKYFTQPEKVEAEPMPEAPIVGVPSKASESSVSPTTKPRVRITDETNGEKSPVYEEDTPAYTGLYGIIAGAIGAAATMIPTFGSVQGDTSPEVSLSTDEDDDDRSSIRTFHSFVTGQETPDEPHVTEVPLSRVDTNGEERSLNSSTESTATHSFNASSTQHEKELRKLEERKRKMEERLQRSQARVLAKRNNEGTSNNDEDVLAKLREKHEREVAKQTDKYQREVRKLEAKRHSEQRKAEERRRKQTEREEKANLTMELEKVRVERDVARKQIEVLKEQIGELQGQNTMLVARLGREGISLDGGISKVLSSDPRRRNSPAPGKISRASTVLGTPSQGSTSPISDPTKGGDRSRERGRNRQAEGMA